MNHPTSSTIRPFLARATSAALLLAFGLGAWAQGPQPATQQDQDGPKVQEKKQGGDVPPPPQLPPGVGKDEGARIEYAVGSQNHDFGRLMQGAIASHTYDLTAGGNEELIIKNVKPTCGCTVTQVMVEGESGEFTKYTYGDPIPVGRRIQLPAKLHTKNKHGRANTRINIFSNDPRGTIQLGLVAEIEAFFTTTPRFLNFGRMQLGQVDTKQAMISVARSEGVHMTLLEQAIPGGVKPVLEALNPDEEGKSSRWQLTVTLGPDLVEGNFARALVIKSDKPIPGSDKDHQGHEQFYQAQITVSAQVVGPFTFAPNYLSMGLVRPGQVVTRTIRVECHDEAFNFSEKQPELKLMGLPIPGGKGYQDWDRSEYFATIVRPVEGQNAIDIELRLEGLPEDATGSFRGTLLVGLGHPEKEDIALTITGVCRGGPKTRRPVPPKTGGGL